MKNSLISRRLSVFFKHFLIFLLSFFPAFNSALANDLPINPDGSTNTHVSKTASGVDQINIAAPNASGLSHNKFSDYNVNRGGQIINNFSGKVVSKIAGGTGDMAFTNTQNAGFVVINSNLKNSGSARLILNEVTSGNNTQLLGYTEIAGTKADLIIANPNGITCNGCGFINTSRLSMVAGKSDNDESGDLHFNLTKQTQNSLSVPLITIEALGLDLDEGGVSKADIIASSVELIGTIYGFEAGSEVTIQTGDDRYSYGNGDISSMNEGDVNQELFAIDASNLGNIQAGKVFIVATKKGFGVNLDAQVIANQDIHIDVAGNLYYNNLSAVDGDIIMNSDQDIASLSVDAQINAQGQEAKITITSNEQQNLGLIKAHDIAIITQNHHSNMGNIIADNDIVLRSKLADINNAGNITALNLIEIEALAGKFANVGDVGYLEIATDDNVTQYYAQNFDLDVQNFDNDGLVYALNVAADVTQLFNNKEQGSFFSGDSNALSTLTSATLKNHGVIKYEGDLTLDVNGDVMNESYLYAKNLTVKTIAGDVNNAGLLVASANLEVQALSSAIDNSGTMQGSGLLKLQAQNIHNSGNILGANHYDENNRIALTTMVDISETNHVDNSGYVESYGIDMHDSVLLDNSGSVVAGLGGAVLQFSDVTNDGLIYSDGDVRIVADRYVRNNKQISALGALTITAHGSDQQGGIVNNGTILSNDALTLNAFNLLNGDEDHASDILLQAITGKLFLNIDNKISNCGEISAKGGLDIAALNYIDNHGLILFSNVENVDLRVKNLNNSQVIYANNNIKITTDSAFDNSGLLSSDANLTLESLTGKILNSGTIQGNGLLDVTVFNLHNSGNIVGLSFYDEEDNMIASTVTKIMAYDTLDNSGYIQSHEIQVSDTGAIHNKEGGNIIADVGGANINGSTLTNDGVIYAQGDVDITSQNVTNNAQISAMSALNITALSVNENDGLINKGKILSNDDMTLTALNFFNGDSDNSDVLTQAIAGKLHVNINNYLGNYGEISAAIATNIAALNILDNHGVILFYNTNDVLLEVGSFNNSKDINARNNVTINAHNAFINSGALLGNAILAIDFAKGEIQNSGSIQGNTILNITSLDLDNSGNIIGLNLYDDNGNLTSSTITTIIASANLTNSGYIQSHKININDSGTVSNKETGHIIAGDGGIDLNASDVTNDGVIYGQGDVDILSNNVTNNAQINVASSLTITALATGQTAGVINKGIVLSDGDMRITAENFLNGDVDQNRDIVTQAIKGQLYLNISNNISNYGEISSGVATHIAALNLLENYGLILFYNTQETVLHVQNLINNASINAQNGLTISADMDIANSGFVLGQSNLTLEALSGKIDNSGIIQGSGTLNLSSFNLYNLGVILGVSDYDEDDRVIRSTKTTFNINNIFDNSGDIQSHAIEVIGSSDFHNQSNANFIAQDGGLDVTASILSNDGVIYTDGEANITLDKVINNSEISALTALTITARGAAVDDGVNNDGTIISQGNLLLYASNLNNGGLDNADSLIQSIAGKLDVIIDNNLSNYAEISAAIATNINVANYLDNAGLILFYNTQDASLIAGTLDNRHIINAQNNLTINTTANIDNSGIILSNQNLRLETLAGSIINSGNIEGSGNLTLKAASLSNSGNIYGADI